jgi:hypothetical protein
MVTTEEGEDTDRAGPRSGRQKPILENGIQALRNVRTASGRDRSRKAPAVDRGGAISKDDSMRADVRKGPGAEGVEEVGAEL